MRNIKNYTTKELLKKFESKSDKNKIKILNKALLYNTGSIENKIFRAMGYVYSNLYHIPTYTYYK